MPCRCLFTVSHDVATSAEITGSTSRPTNPLRTSRCCFRGRYTVARRTGDHRGGERPREPFRASRGQQRPTCSGRPLAGRTYLRALGPIKQTAPPLRTLFWKYGKWPGAPSTIGLKLILFHLSRDDTSNSCSWSADVDGNSVRDEEPPFVGDQRRDLVDRLLADFDRVSESGTPRWWSLEANSGWGKTRIVQEFYRRLAERRQHGAGYWPPSLIPDVLDATIAGASTSMRKRVYPEQVVRQPNVVPEWFWWGISCATRSGTPVQALAEDLTQFEAHRDALERRWRQLVPRKARLGAGLSSKRGELVETAVGEGLSAAASLANAAIPGLGVLALAAKWGVQGLRDGRLAAQAPPFVDAARRGRSDLVDDLAPALERFAAAGMPMVIVIEDLHLADESLVELLARLLAAQEARILVVSTAWRGLLDEHHRASHRLLVRLQPDRLCRVLADDALEDLAPSEREEIVRATLPNVSAGNARGLATSYTNPWALQLACNVGWVRRAEREFTAAEVDRLPRDIDGLFTQLWKELPEEMRKALMIAALGTPTGISTSMGFGDARWDSSLLTAVSRTQAWLSSSAGDPAALLSQTSDAYAWIRSVDEWLRRFHDPGQHDVAVGQAKVEYDDSECRLLYEAMAGRMSAGVAESPSQDLHHARLLVALASEGFLPWDEITLAGAVTLCGSLLDLPDVLSRQNVILIAETALGSTTIDTSVTGPVLGLLALWGNALSELGRLAEAVTTFEQLLVDQTRLLGPDRPSTLTTRHNLAHSLLASGRVAEAITAFEQLLKDKNRVLGQDNPSTLTTRNNLAQALGESGRVAEAITAFEQLLKDQQRVHDPDAAATQTTRNNLAVLLVASGQVAEAVTEFQQLTDDSNRVLGPDHPNTLITRNNLARALGRSGRVAEAIAAFEQLLKDQNRVLGPDNPTALATRNNLAELLGESGRLVEAIAAFERLLKDQNRVLGPDNPDTLDTRGNLALLLGESGRVTDAIASYKRLIKDQNRVRGPDDPESLLAVSNFAVLLGESGRVAEATTMLKQLLKDQLRVLGPDAPQTLNTRINLAFLLAELGQVFEAIITSRKVLDDVSRVLGPDHPLTLNTRKNLASLFAESGRVNEATRTFEQLITDSNRVLGPDHPDTLGTRNDLALLLGKSGRVAEAITAFNQL